MFFFFKDKVTLKLAIHRVNFELFLMKWQKCHHSLTPDILQLINLSTEQLHPIRCSHYLQWAIRPCTLYNTEEDICYIFFSLQLVG